MNISLPDWLADQVRNLAISPSPVCQEALQHEVRKVKTMQASTAEKATAAAVRLRARGDEPELVAAERANGYQDGQHWAFSEALQIELEAVEEGVSLPIFRADDETWPTLVYRLEDCRQMRGHLSEAYFDGFTEGATEAWEAVKAEL